VLAGAPALLLAAACSADAPAPRPAPVDPDDALRAAAAERERGLLREYDAAIAARPALAPRLRPVRDHHAEHLEVLTGPSATPSATPSGAAPPVPPPADDAAALARLVAAERAAGDAHAADCLTASRALAPVLASLSASELSHPVALA
jgi:hypothetical protein